MARYLLNSEAKIEARAGLQTSQPSEEGFLPHSLITSSIAVNFFTEMMLKRSAREYSK